MNQIMRNFSWHRILGVPKNANLGEIKSQYVKMTKMFHPDSKDGSVDRFLMIRNAY